MGTWIVRVKAEISDEMEVEAETEEEAITNAHESWSFLEAHSWEEEIVSRPEDLDDPDSAAELDELADTELGAF